MTKTQVAEQLAALVAERLKTVAASSRAAQPRSILLPDDEAPVAKRRRPAANLQNPSR